MKSKYGLLVISGLILLGLSLSNRGSLCELRLRIMSAELSAVLNYETRQ